MAPPPDTGMVKRYTGMAKPKPKAKKAKAAPKRTLVDPFAQQSPQQIQQAIAQQTSRLPSGPTPQQINQFTRQARQGLPAPLTNQQITRQAQASIDPVIAQITKAVNARAQAQQRSVSGYTDQLANQLAGLAPTLAAPYERSAEASAATTQSLADRLQSGGQQTAGDLSAKLAAINAPGATGEATGKVAQEGVGAGNALYATGTADVQELLKNAASARAYGEKQPGIARLAGAQQAGLVGRQAVSDIADQTGQVIGQLPSIVQNLRTQSDTRGTNRSTAGNRMFEYLTSLATQAQGNRGQLGAEMYETMTGQNLGRATAAESIRQFNASLGQDYAALGAEQQQDANQFSYDAQQDAIRNQQAQDRITISNKRANQSAQPKPPKVNTTLSAANGYLTDSSGNPILRGGKRVAYKKPGAKGGKGGISAVSYANLKTKAGKAADVFYWGDEEKGIAALDYSAAFNRLVSEYSLKPRDAMTILNNFYAPGEAGRPQIGHDYTGHLRGADANARR